MLDFGKRETKALAAVLQGEYGTVDEAAEAALEAAWAEYEKRAKYMVIVQSEALDGQRNTFCVGPFSTRKKAEAAISPTLKADCQWMVVEQWHGTGSAYFARRREEQKEAKLDKSQAERLIEILRERGDIPALDKEET